MSKAEHYAPAHNPNPIVVEAYAVPDQAYSAPADPVAALHRQASIQASRNAYNEGGARELLSMNKWPAGLQDTFVKNLPKLPMRFFICDDSGSMVSSDGKKLVNNKLVSCSRWSELTEALKFHAALAKAACAPTEFRLLNGAPPIVLGTNDADEQNRFETLMAIFDNSPNGGTPLCYHINQIITQIRAMEPQLRASGQKACLVICTDGESSDGDIAHAMRPLQQLPVWVVIRLCTDDEKIVNYWNNIDSQLELDMDVLDDLTGEAGEVSGNNAWLTYGEPLHRLREFGVQAKELDLIDEGKLSLEQTRQLCALIFGGAAGNYPHPEADFPAFVNAIDAANKRVGTVWNPLEKAQRPWVNIAKLQKLNPHSSGCTIC